MQLKILSYCVAHPDAKDTVEGIQQWWGVGDRGVDRLELTEMLDELTSRHWLNRRTTRQSGLIYSVNKSHLPEIRRYLESAVSHSPAGET